MMETESQSKVESKGKEAGVVSEKDSEAKISTKSKPGKSSKKYQVPWYDQVCH